MTLPCLRSWRPELLALTWRGFALQTVLFVHIDSTGSASLCVGPGKKQKHMQCFEPKLIHFESE